MTTNERDEKVDRLLHDAEHAKSGFQMAQQMIGRIPGATMDAARLRAKYHGLMNEARSIDPKQEAPAWSGADV